MKIVPWIIIYIGFAVLYVLTNEKALAKPIINIERSINTVQQQHNVHSLRKIRSYRPPINKLRCTYITKLKRECWKSKKKVKYCRDKVVRMEQVCEDSATSTGNRWLATKKHRLKNKKKYQRVLEQIEQIGINLLY